MEIVVKLLQARESFIQNILTMVFRFIGQKKLLNVAKANLSVNPYISQIKDMMK